MTLIVSSEQTSPPYRKHFVNLLVCKQGGVSAYQVSLAKNWLMKHNQGRPINMIHSYILAARCYCIEEKTYHAKHHLDATSYRLPILYRFPNLGRIIFKNASSTLGCKQVGIQSCRQGGSSLTIRWYSFTFCHAELPMRVRLLSCLHESKRIPTGQTSCRFRSAPGINTRRCSVTCHAVEGVLQYLNVFHCISGAYQMHSREAAPPRQYPAKVPSKVFRWRLPGRESVMETGCKSCRVSCLELSWWKEQKNTKSPLSNTAANICLLTNTAAQQGNTPDAQNASKLSEWPSTSQSRSFWHGTSTNGNCTTQSL